MIIKMLLKLCMPGKLGNCRTCCRALLVALPFGKEIVQD